MSASDTQHLVILSTSIQMFEQCGHVHVVLSTLYQEKMVTVQEVEDLKPGAQLWNHLVQIQLVKSPHVVKRTAELLVEVGRNEEGGPLKGQECI